MDRLNASDLGGSYAPERADDDARAPTMTAKAAPKPSPTANADKPLQKRPSVADQYLKGTHQAVTSGVSQFVADDAVSRGAFLYSGPDEVAPAKAAEPSKPASKHMSPPADKTLSRSRNSSARESARDLAFAESHTPVPMSVSQLLAGETDIKADDGGEDYRERLAKQNAPKQAPPTRPTVGSRRSTDDGPQRRPTVESLMSVHGAETHKPVSMSVSALLADEYQSAFTLHDKEEEAKEQQPKQKLSSRRSTEETTTGTTLSQRRNSRDLTSIVHQGGKPTGVAAGHFSLSSLVGDEVDVARQESGPRQAAPPQMSAVEKAKAEARAKLRQSQEEAAIEAASKKTYYTAGGVFKPHGATNASLHASVAN